MAKYSGSIGFATSTETYPGVWEEVITDRKYYGDLIRSRANVQQNAVNGSVNITNEISIIADPYAYENCYSMRYITFLNKKWCVNSIEVEYPRLKITMGGLYNG